MPNTENLVSLQADETLWERVFTVAPLVLVGTREPDGRADLAPKHLAFPMWGPWYGFVCSPTHATYRNAVSGGAFTVSFPKPGHVVLTSLAASPRYEDGEKHALEALETLPAREVDGVLVADCSFHLECRLDRTVDGFGANSLVIGRVVAAHADPDALRTLDREDDELIHTHPLLAYLYPKRFASIDQSLAFPFPAGFKR
ncbi:MAG: flavin reductase [Deltaproteobacteria bacterium]|nr:flavin reductase [Deltaproteobacteria bacterium]MBW2361938.1 flavin reductase [Deltaproteobacteria bacterium]